MPRYVNQPAINACGPTAIINAAKWAGVNLSIKKDFDYAAYLCKYDPSEGSAWDGIDRAIREAMPGFVKVRKPTFTNFDRIDRHLTKGQACLVSVVYEEDETCHIFLATGKQGKLFVAHNYNTIKRTTLLREKTIREHLLHPHCWFLTKE